MTHSATNRSAPDTHLQLQWPARAQQEIGKKLTADDVSVLKHITAELLTAAGAGKSLTDDPPLPQVNMTNDEIVE